MGKSTGILGAVFLGAGVTLLMEAASPLHEQKDELQLSGEDNKTIGVLRAFDRCVEGRMALPSEQIIKELRDYYRTKAEALRKNGVPNDVIISVTNATASQRLHDWAENECTVEVNADRKMLNNRLEEMQSQRQTPYGQKFWRTLSAP